MISVKYYRKADGNIFLRCFPIPKQELKFYVNENVKLKEWDVNKQRVNRYHADHKDINYLLDTIADFVRKQVRTNRINNHTTTIEGLKKALRVRLGIEPKINYYVFAKDHINSLRISNTITASTFKKYMSKIKIMSSNYPNLTFSQITKGWVVAYIDKARKKDYKDSTIAKELKFIKQILRASHGEGLHTNTIFNNDVMSLKYEESDKEIYLTSSQILQIYYYKFPTSDNYKEQRHYLALRNAAKQLVRACLTGQRYSDFDKLGKESIEIHDDVKLIQVKRQQKGKKQVWIPLHPIVDQILNEGVTLVSNAKLNKQIKEVGKLAGIPNYEMIKTHTGRRSLCTNLLIAGVDRSKIKLISGHSDDKAFNRYIRIDSLSNAMMMSKEAYFNHSKEEADFYKEGLKVV